MTLTGENRRIRRKTCPSATSSNTNPTRTDLSANAGLRGEKPATDRLSYGKALLERKQTLRNVPGSADFWEKTTTGLGHTRLFLTCDRVLYSETPCVSAHNGILMTHIGINVT
jgi:hypothetical protein